MKGLNEMVQNMQQLKDRYLKAGAIALYEVAGETMTQSQEQCPVDTGALRSSAYVEQPVRKGDSVHLKMGYGGVATKINPATGESTAKYAVYVHEDLNKHHPVGKAKFLEDPIRARQTTVSSDIAEKMKVMLKL